MKPPKDLDKIADAVLAYRPKPKSKAAKKRKRRATYHPHKCVVCGAVERRNARGYCEDKIYRSGECQECYEERKMGY